MERERLTELLEYARLQLRDSNRVEVSGRDPVLANRHPAGEVAACALALVGDAASHLHSLRGGDLQRIEVDVADASASLLGFLFLKSSSGIDVTRQRNATIAFYATRDDRFIHLHGGFPHLAEGLLKLLDCPLDADAIATSVRKFDSFTLEQDIADLGLCGAVARTCEEWNSHPQGQALAPLPAVEILRLGEAPVRPLPPLGTRPLENIRALDLTRVLAGPTCGRTLAEQGASVLRIGSEALPSVDPFVMETGRGKRNAFLDLKKPIDAQRLRDLISEADVVCQGYRSGALERMGFGPESVAANQPGIVYVSINCYGHEGPWYARPGWEQLAQTACGIAIGEGGDENPRLISAAATDYTTGYLAAYGAMEALQRRATEGGSWHVRVSLAQTAMWLTRAGHHLDPAQAIGLGNIERLQVESETAWGKLGHLGPVLRMSATPPHCRLPPAPLGRHAASWSE